MDVLDFLNDPDPTVYESDYFVLDFETTNKSKGSARDSENAVVMSSRKDGERLSSSFLTEYQLDAECELAESKILVAHNAKFELQWLARGGCDLTKVLVWDTMIGEYVLNGNLKVPLDLGSVAERYGLPNKEAFVDICIKGGVCPSEIPKSFLQRRCEYDVLVTEQIFLRQRERIINEGKLGVMLTRCLLTPVLADIEFNGMHPDPDRVHPAYNAALQKWNDCVQELRVMYPDVNWNSPKQVSELLYDTLEFKEIKDHRGNTIKTPAGGRKADADTIAALKPRNKKQKKIQELILQEAKLNTQLKFLTKLKDCCEHEQILHANFNQTVTSTHRLSSSGTKYKVQFQNMAREYKPLFSARNPGWSIGEQDGAQLEFRVAAFQGQDEVAIQDIRDQVDVHSYTSETITNAGQETDRQEAKAHTFKPLFGGTSGTEAEKAYYEAFREKYKGIADTQQQWIDTVLRYKKLRIESGLEFFWPKVKQDPKTGYVNFTPSICNYPVQSLATADIIPIALIHFWHKIKKLQLKSFIVNTIHDSIISEVHPEEHQIYTDIGIECFTADVYRYLKKVYNIDFNVPLGVGTKLGSNWSEGHEYKIQVEPEEL